MLTTLRYPELPTGRARNELRIAIVGKGIEVVSDIVFRGGGNAVIAACREEMYRRPRPKD